MFSLYLVLIMGTYVSHQKERYILTENYYFDLNDVSTLMIGLFSITDCFHNNSYNTNIMKKEIAYREFIRNETDHGYLAIDVCNHADILVETLMRIFLDLNVSNKNTPIVGILSYMSSELTVIAASILTVSEIPYRAMVSDNIIMSNELTNRLFDALLYDDGKSFIDFLNPHSLQWAALYEKESLVEQDRYSIRLCYRDKDACLCQPSPYEENDDHIFYIRNSKKLQLLFNNVANLSPNSTKFKPIEIAGSYDYRMAYIIQSLLNNTDQAIVFSGVYYNLRTVRKIPIQCSELKVKDNKCITTTPVMIDFRLVHNDTANDLGGVDFLDEPLKQLIAGNYSCIAPCQPGMTMHKYEDQDTEQIIFTCIPCQNNSVKSTTGDGRCFPCPIGWISNANHTSCYDTYQNITLKFTDSLSVVMMSLSCAGFTAISTTIFLFIKHIKSPIVKSSNVMLSFIQLVSQMTLLILLPFIFIRDANILMCTLRPFVVTVLVPIMIGVSICKTQSMIHIYQKRVVLTRHDVHMKKITEIFLLFLFVIIGLGILCVNLENRRSDIMLYISTVKMVRERYCKSNDHIVILFVYFTTLLIINAIQAYRAKRLPENLKETRVIGFSSILMIMLLCSMIWLYIYERNYYKKRLFIFFTVCSLNLLNFFLLYGYKVYILLFMPEINTKHHFNMCLNRRVTKDSTRKMIEIRDKLKIEDAWNYGADL